MKKRRFFSVTVGAMALSVGLVLANYGGGVTPAAAVSPASNPGNPFRAILDKLDQVLAAITGAAGQGNHTLRWDTNNASDSRFITAFTGAVRDNNTGLVWEQAPDATLRKWQDFGTSFLAAPIYCVNKTVGGTVGWRLPSVAELKSVQDPSLPAPFVPAIFTGVQSANYWSAATSAGNPANAWSVGFGPNGNVLESPKAFTLPAWCVRGGMNADVY